MKTAPFYGRGLAFPFRLNPATGGVQITEGSADAPPVALEYVGDRFTIREDLPDWANHIAEAIAHILLTAQYEHDTLPEFGGRLNWLLFDPNTEDTQELANHYFSTATERWEKRAKIHDPDGIVGGCWAASGRQRSRSKS